MILILFVYIFLRKNDKENNKQTSFLLPRAGAHQPDRTSAKEGKQGWI